MIEVNYNEYKETIAENMKLIIENHDLKEKINKAIKYIEDLFKEINLSNQTIVAIRTIERLLEGVDKE